MCLFLHVLCADLCMSYVRCLSLSCARSTLFCEWNLACDMCGFQLDLCAVCSDKPRRLDPTMPRFALWEGPNKGPWKDPTKAMAPTIIEMALQDAAITFRMLANKYKIK